MPSVNVNQVHARGDSTTPDMGTTPVSPGTGAQNINSTGPNTVEVGSLELSLGQWELNMTQTINTYLPVGVNNAPTIILHHGFGLSAQDYASYGSYLASWGYVVIHAQYGYKMSSVVRPNATWLTS